MNSQDFAAYLDATNLKLDSTDAEICALCDEAAEAGYASVCVYPTSVAICSSILYSSASKVCTVIGFPHGRATTASKQAEIVQVKDHGANEVDIVMNYPALRAGERNLVADEIASLCQIARQNDLLTKIIVETCFLKEAEKMASLKICEEAQADFIKTSTGFGSGGATLKDIQLFASEKTTDIRIKASGGIRDYKTAQQLIDSGANRLGVSAAAKLIAEFNGEQPATDASPSDY